MLTELQELLHELAGMKEWENPRTGVSIEQIRKLAFSFRDCHLELIRLHGATLSDDQLHRLEQMDYRLQMVVDGKGSAASIPAEAEKVIAAFAWSGDDR